MRIVIVGAGEVGFHIAERLSSENKDVVIIDLRAEALKRVSEHLDVQTIQGSGSSPRVLEEAGVKGADILLAVTNSDETNLVATLFANLVAPHLTKVVRIRDEEYISYHKELTSELLNLNMVINPETEVVRSIRQLMHMPGALEVTEFAEGRIRMVGIRLPKGCPIAGTRLIDVREVTRIPDLIIAGLVRDDELIVPTGADVISEDDLLYFVCRTENTEAVLAAFGVAEKKVREVLIIGGGNVGLQLAQSLDSRHYHVKLIEEDTARSHFLSAKLDRPVVLNGDGTDRELLQEENIGQMDVVVSLTGDEETNILSCLLAKSLGAGSTIARINKLAYMPLARAIGIEHIVSSRLSAVNSILHFIRRGNVVSTVSIKGEEAEAMEAIALDHSDLVGRPLKEVTFPKNALLLTVMHGEEVMLPTGDFIIQPQDRIIILAKRAAIEKVEQALMVKLEYF